MSVFELAELAADLRPNPRNVGVLLELAGPAPMIGDVGLAVASGSVRSPPSSPIRADRRDRSSSSADASPETAMEVDTFAVDLRDGLAAVAALAAQPAS